MATEFSSGYTAPEVLNRAGIDSSDLFAICIIFIIFYTTIIIEFDYIVFPSASKVARIINIGVVRNTKLKFALSQLRAASPMCIRSGWCSMRW